MTAIIDFENKSKYFSYYDDKKEKHQSIEAIYSCVTHWEEVRFNAFGASYKEATENLIVIIKAFRDDMTRVLEDS